MRLLRFFLIFLVLFSSGCSSLMETTPTVTVTLPLADASAPPNGTALLGPTLTPTAIVPTLTPTPAGPPILRVWVPAQFDPNSDTPAGILLNARLQAFISEHPGVHIDLRVKAIEGEGGLINSLATASAAAPQALPDLVALPRPLLENAALKGLVRPFEGLDVLLAGDDWYDYARQLAMVQDAPFGLPIAGDALVLAYRPGVIATAPVSWADMSSSYGPLIFAAADPQASFTLAMYQAAGGETQDDQGRPLLTPAILAQVLAFYQDSKAAGMMPPRLIYYETEQQAWEDLDENQVNWAVTWASRYLSTPILPRPEVPATSTTRIAAAPLPTPSGRPYTLADGWVWAFASTDPNKGELTLELVEYLTDPAFLGSWTEAAGLLPTRPSALQIWQSPEKRQLADAVSRSAHVYPPIDLLLTLAPALQTVTIRAINEIIDPQILADSAASEVQSR